MLELPDLVYLQKRLSPLLNGQRITAVEISAPIVVRMLLPGEFSGVVAGSEIAGVRRHGPFLVFSLSDHKELIIHPMLAGRFKITGAGEKSRASAGVG
jgi:formamidopyrimidine-DNA glycosylase